MRLDLYTKTKLIENATSFFLRLQHTNPFPAFKEGIVPKNTDLVYNTYISCLPPDIRHAVLLLMAADGYSNFLNNNKSSILAVTRAGEISPGVRGIAHIKFTFGSDYPSCHQWVKKAYIDHEHISYNEILNWAYKAREIDKEYRRCTSYTAHVIEDANTVGQLRTMFPDYVRLLPENHQQHIAKMQKRSTLPKGVDTGFLAKHRQFVAEKVALCLLLPEGKEKIWPD